MYLNVWVPHARDWHGKKKSIIPWGQLLICMPSSSFIVLFLQMTPVTFSVKPRKTRYFSLCSKIDKMAPTFFNCRWLLMQNTVCAVTILSAALSRNSETYQQTFTSLQSHHSPRIPSMLCQTKSLVRSGNLDLLISICPKTQNVTLSSQN